MVKTRINTLPRVRVRVPVCVGGGRACVRVHVRACTGRVQALVQRATRRKMLAQGTTLGGGLGSWTLSPSGTMSLGSVNHEFRVSSGGHHERVTASWLA